MDLFHYKTAVTHSIEFCHSLEPELHPYFNVHNTRAKRRRWVGTNAVKLLYHSDMTS